MKNLVHFILFMLLLVASLSPLSSILAGTGAITAKQNLVLMFSSFTVYPLAAVSVALSFRLKGALKVGSALFASVFLVALYIVLFSHKWEMFTYSYERSIDLKLRPNLEDLVRLRGSTWTNCDRFVCPEQKAAVAEKLKIGPMIANFKGLWVYDSCGTNTNDLSWIAVFSSTGVIWGSCHGCADQMNYPMISIDHVLFKQNIGEDWLFVGRDD